MDLGNVSLPPPPSGQKPLHVTVGRGIQNYTCSSPESAPTAVGAVATLYDAGCLAAHQPAVFDLTPDIILQFSLPTKASAVLSDFNANILGHHFFLNASTPVFDLNTPDASFGKVIAQKLDSINAPALLQGNHWCSRDYGTGSHSNGYGRGDACHYSNSNGSYYYKNSNGSTYYNNGKGGSVYTPPGGKR